LIFTDKEEQYIRSQKVCVISTVQKDGKVHLVPIRFHYDGRSIFIPTHEKRKKIENLRSSRKVGVLVSRFHGEGGNAEGVMIQGRAELLDGGQEYLKAGDAIGIRTQGFDEKRQIYTYGPYKQLIIKVSPEAKASWGINHTYRGSRTYAETGVID
jgi:predicted pyridoxine 5'-phosphate oxidase superfamily flavin-nucleotide-binding protein